MHGNIFEYITTLSLILYKIRSERETTKLKDTATVCKENGKKWKSPYHNIYSLSIFLSLTSLHVSLVLYSSHLLHALAHDLLACLLIS